MTAIRPFTSYEDAVDACCEAGFECIGSSTDGKSLGRSFVPTLTFEHPDAGEVVEVAWVSGRVCLYRRPLSNAER